MKKAILFSSIFAIGAAVAVDSDNAIGVTTINPTDKGAQKLVAVPFDGYVSGAVKVGDLVSPTGLAEGSKLYVVVSGGYAVWSLSEDGDWVPGKIVSIGKNGQQTEGANFNADEVTVNRGDAFWLEPATGSATTAYLLGQMPESTSSGSVTTSAGKWNYIGNPLTVAAKFSGAESGDKVYVQDANGKQMSCLLKSEGWQYRNGAGNIVTVSFGPGEGFWFYSASARTLTWSAATPK